MAGYAYLQHHAGVPHVQHYLFDMRCPRGAPADALAAVASVLAPLGLGLLHTAPPLAVFAGPRAHATARVALGGALVTVDIHLDAGPAGATPLDAAAVEAQLASALGCRTEACANS